MSGIQTRFNDFQASHIQLADRIYLTALRTEFGYKGATPYSQCGYPSQDKDDYYQFNVAYVGEYKKKNTRKRIQEKISMILIGVVWIFANKYYILQIFRDWTVSLLLAQQ
ncbi:hypothetical protein BYT27DRAFT_7186466 [Phlegmacium glaucopus]|nr:hypothetical protein BYT27DRAFT_7186466 [Phlegmacium glaucopus]